MSPRIDPIADTPPPPVGPPDSRRFARARVAWPARRLVVAAVLAPVLIVVLVAIARDGADVGPPAWMALVALVALACATTLASYVPRPGAGWRLDVGCTPCASAAALSVVAAAGVLSSDPHDVPTAIVALGVAAFGARQRLMDPSTCAV